MDRLVLVDATAFCYRAFYALHGLVTSFGQPTNAVYGFITMLNKIVKENKSEYLAVCFDVSRDTVRQKKFAAYKIHRPPMPDDLKSQIPLIKEVVSAYGIAMVEKEGFEADDIIATLALKAKKKGMGVTIVSSDKDILQLVDAQTIVFNPGKEADVVYDQQKVEERFGVVPSQISEIIALMGDDVDNIPGVPGIGEKTAAALLEQFGNLEKLLENTDKIKSEKIRKAIEEKLEQIKLSHDLAILDKEIDLDLGIDELKIAGPDHKELYRLFKYLEFKKFLKDLPPGEENKEVTATEIDDRDLKEIKIKDSELVLYGKNIDDLVFSVSGKLLHAHKVGINIKNMLSEVLVKKVGHDLKSTKLILAKEGIDLATLSFDTMIAAYLLNPSRAQYTLTELAWGYLGEMVTDEALDSRRAVALIGQLKPKLEAELRDKSLWELFTKLEMPLVEVLSEMELAGIALDVKILKHLSQDIEKRLAKLIEEIFRLCECQFNINSPKQLREVLFEKLKLPVVKRTKSGPSTDEEVLRTLAEKYELPKSLLEYRQLMKLKTTYVDTLPELVNPGTGRVHTSFNQTGTETGRLSSSDPNLQNIPIKTEIGSNIRRAVIASGAENCLLSCDYSQIELRILAHLSKDENLIAAFKENTDIHKATAALIYGLRENEVEDHMRETAKRVNFGIVYGLTAYGLSRDLRIGVQEAQNFIDAYFLRYPRVKEYIELQIKKCEEQGFVTTILGRRRYIPEIKNKNQGIRQFAQRQAVNTPIQGSASDLIKSAMIEIYQKIKEWQIKTQMVLQIHDELLFDAPYAEVSDFLKLAKDRMENVLRLEVPIRVVIKQGKNWLEMEEVR